MMWTSVPKRRYLFVSKETQRWWGWCLEGKEEKREFFFCPSKWFLRGGGWEANHNKLSERHNDMYHSNLF